MVVLTLMSEGRSVTAFAAAIAARMATTSVSPSATACTCQP
jgi:hypothetical protein